MNKPTNIEDMLQSGLKLHLEGNFQQAESLYRAILQAKPSHPDANHLLGVLSLQAGDNAAAVKLISKAIRKKPGEASYHRNLGASLGGVGRLDDSIKSLRKALRLDPTVAEVHYNLGSVLQQKGLLVEAVKSFQNACRINPGHGQSYNNAGTALLALGRPGEAMESYQKALDIAPDSADVLYNMGIAQGQLGRHDEAISYYQRALAIQPGYLKALLNLGNSYKEREMFDQALKSFSQVIAINPDHAVAHCNRGAVLEELGRLDEAREALHKAIELDPKFAEPHHNLGNTYQKLGRMEKSHASFRAAINLKPDYAEAHRRLALSHTHTVHDAEISAMEELFASPRSSDEDRMHLAFGLGKAYEDLGQFDAAFNILKDGNAYKRKSYSYDIADDETFMKKICTVFSASFFDNLGTPGVDDSTPIFIVGMPRSGTSLVEQILASHSDVHGAGELDYIAKMRSDMCEDKKQPFPQGVLDFSAADFQGLGRTYVEKLRTHSPQAKFITDKMPHNFINIGIIKAALPRATIIHCNRNPMATCFSIYKYSFYGTHPYAYDMEELGQYYRLYLMLMDHWRSLFAGSIIDVQYEQLVAKPEHQIRQLLGACGLAFEEACLDFHKSDRVVQTLSVNQVRKPMYNSAIEAWKRFEKDLGPLIKAVNGA